MHTSKCACYYKDYTANRIGISTVIRIQSNTGDIIDFPTYFKHYSPLIEVWIDFNYHQRTPEAAMIYRTMFSTEQLTLLLDFVNLIYTHSKVYAEEMVYDKFLKPLNNRMLTSLYLMPISFKSIHLQKSFPTKSPVAYFITSHWIKSMP